MNLSALPSSEVASRLCSEGLALRIGPFGFRIISKIDSVLDGLLTLYADYPIANDGEFVDFTVTIARGKGFRRWVNRQAVFVFDGGEPFTPLAEAHAFPLLEWAMNWCISTQTQHYLLLHSAVIERHGCAAILPAPPGSGKSTLCAGLIHRGWRLLSDELAVISLLDGSVLPLGRPVSLKNQSIAVIRNFVPDAVMNRASHDTSKGTVTHLKVPKAHLDRINEAAVPRWVVLPKYVPQSAAVMTPRSKASTMLELGRNSFNYTVLGLKGFEVLSRVIDGVNCFDFQYSQLDDAVEKFDALARSQA